MKRRKPIRIPLQDRVKFTTKLNLSAETTAELFAFCIYSLVNRRDTSYEAQQVLRYCGFTDDQIFEMHEENNNES